MEIQVGRRPEAAYDWLELTIRFEAEYENPFDPQEIEVWAVFAGPNGTVRVFGFWDQPFERRSEPAGDWSGPAGCKQALAPSGEPGWRIRYTPQVPGLYRVRVIVRDRTGAVQAADGPAITVPEGTRPGFVEVSRHDPAYFAHRTGELYVPHGENMGWGRSGRTYDFDIWCRRLAESGGNFIRVWMSSWSFAIEGPEDGPGRYRLDRAWELDYLFNLCEQLNIQVMLVLVNHGICSTWCNEEWEKNVYNAVNPDGFLANAEDFFTDYRAREFFRRRLRYIIARWGHSPALMCWELFNEVDLTDGWKKQKAAVGDWHGEMARHIRSLDPYGHLVGSSYMGDTRDPLLWHVPELDFVQYHTYGHKDLASHTAWVSGELRRYGRPVTIAEFGTDTQGADTKDQQGVWLREGLWAPIFGKAAGSGWPWWWDTCIEPLNLYGHWTGLVRFLEGEALDREGYRPVAPECTGAEAYALVGTNRALLWLKNPDWTWSRAPGPYAVASDVVAHLGLAPGNWTLEWWDCAGGVPIRRESALGGTDGLTVHVGSVATDIAVKLWRTTGDSNS